jgi:flagellar hook-length control protein FliK
VTNPSEDATATQATSQDVSDADTHLAVTSTALSTALSASDATWPDPKLLMPLAAEVVPRVTAEPNTVSLLTQASSVDAALHAMPQRAAVKGASDTLSALTQGVSSVRPTLGASGADAFVSTAAVAQQVNASGVDLNPRDLKNHLLAAQGRGVDWRSDVPLMVNQPELMKLSATVLEEGAQKPLQKTRLTVDAGGWIAPSFQAADSRMGGAPTPEVGANAAIATTLAQQVNYWIGRDVQSAELKLDGLGHSPVEVSISMQGREAHVEFRAEQIEARQIIEQAMPQLKALLQSEGLALAGVSIGSSGAEASFSQAKQPKQPPRQGAARVAELGLMDVGGRTRPGAGRALDLFV